MAAICLLQGLMSMISRARASCQAFPVCMPLKSNAYTWSLTYACAHTCTCASKAEPCMEGLGIQRCCLQTRKQQQDDSPDGEEEAEEAEEEEAEEDDEA